MTPRITKSFNIQVMSFLLIIFIGAIALSGCGLPSASSSTETPTPTELVIVIDNSTESPTEETIATPDPQPVDISPDEGEWL
jgi:hypothetical protein